MEQKLQEYRKSKRKDAVIQQTKQFVQNIFPWTNSSALNHRAKQRLEENSHLINSKDKLKMNNEEDKLNESLIMNEVEVDPEEVEEDDSQSNPFMKATYLLYFLLWATLYLIAIQLEFGAVYFIISSLFLIYKNTRTKPKKPGEISAYSVFNPNCESIDGTLNAEQFEREIRFGAL